MTKLDLNRKFEILGTKYKPDHSKLSHDHMVHPSCFFVSGLPRQKHFELWWYTSFIHQLQNFLPERTEAILRGTKQ